MKTQASTAFALLLLASVESSAATVTFTLDFTAGWGQFILYAETSAGDNAGLASYSVALKNALTVNHHSLRNAAAESYDGALRGPVGFTQSRSADDTNPAIGNVLIQGSQDTVTPTPFIIYGLGQTGGDLASRGIITAGSKEGDPWAAKMVIATGTWDPRNLSDYRNLPGIDATAPLTASIFKNRGSLDIESAQIYTLPWPPFFPDDLPTFPEPSSGCLALIAAATATQVTRRARSAATATLHLEVAS
jgi:hypothetical protein